MTSVSIGDQSRAFVSRLQNFRLKAEMQRLGEELSSGRKTRPGTETTGDTSHLLGIKRAQTMLGGYRTTTAEAQFFAETAQASLDVLQSTADIVGPGLLTAASTRSPTQLRAASFDAGEKFASIVSALNVNVGDKTIFGGAATDRPPLSDAESMLTDLRAAVGSEPTVSGIVAIVDDWFGTAGAGFETVGYKGSDSANVSFRVSDGEDIRMTMTAQSAEIRAVLKSFALGALVTAPGIATDPSAQAELAQTAGEWMIDSERDLSDARAVLGSVQARIALVASRQSGEKTALEIAEARYIAADPYETATALQEVQAQLETLYTITSRLSGLSLTNFLK